MRVLTMVLVSVLLLGCAPTTTPDQPLVAAPNETAKTAAKQPGMPPSEQSPTLNTEAASHAAIVDMTRPSPGFISFGTGLVESEMRVKDWRVAFVVGEPIWFVAGLTEPAGATSLILSVSSVGERGETPVWQDRITVPGPDIDTISGRLQSLPPGGYRMRVIRGATVLAKNIFLVRSGEAAVSP